MAEIFDPAALRQSYAQRLSEQQKKAIGGVQNVFAQRGTTGSGEEATAMGETGLQFGLGAGQNELNLQQLGMQQQLANQQFGLQSELGRGNLALGQAGLAQSGQQFGQSLAEQVAGRQQSGEQFGQNLAQQGAQFGQNLALQQQQMYGGSDMTKGTLAAQQLAQQGTQFGLNLDQQKTQFGQQMGLQQSQQDLAKQQMYGGTDYAGKTLQGQEFAAGQQETQELNKVASNLGFANSTELQTALASGDPGVKNMIFNYYQNLQKAKESNGQGAAFTVGGVRGSPWGGVSANVGAF